MNQIHYSIRRVPARIMRLAAIIVAVSATPLHAEATSSGSECQILRSSSGEDGAVITRQAIFNPGEEGSKFYRIPATRVLPSGRIVAVADKRIDSNADLPEIGRAHV